MMKKEVFKTLLIIGAFYAVSFLVENLFGSKTGEFTLGILVLLFALKLIKERKILQIKTIIWFTLLNLWVYVAWVLVS